MQGAVNAVNKYQLRIVYGGLRVHSNYTTVSDV